MRTQLHRMPINRRTFLSLFAGATTLRLARPNLAGAKSSAADDLTRLTLQEAAMRVRNRDVSPVALAEACLARIERYDAQIKAFITVTSQLALEQAQAAEREIRGGRWRGPLHGIPIGLKDNIDTAGILTTSGKPKFSNRVPAEDAEVVRRLKSAGAVLIGKLNLGPGGRTWGTVCNPWALDHECAYSSSGAAAAIAAGFRFGALGTDFAGSVRLPASACGVAGLKPTYGLVSNRGAPQGPMNHVGPIGKTVLDTALLLDGIAGYDPQWVDSAELQVPEYATAVRKDRRRLRIGIPRAGFFDDLDPEVARLMGAALETVGAIGQISSDGVRIPLYWDIYTRLAVGSPAPLQEDGRHALQDARNGVAETFPDQIDLLVLPTWKRLPMTNAERRKTWPLPKDQLRRELWNTVPFNILGLPAISVPCGFSKGGLPVGLQIVGRPFADERVLAFAHSYEQATRWHLQRPKLDPN